MKRIPLLSICLILFGWAHGQKKTTGTDPSYSAHNYKHPNKVSVARSKNLDGVTPLKSVLVSGGSEYKHRYNQSWFVVKAAFRTRPVNSKSRATTKHPLGL
jgi:hypothetical protein